MHSVTTFLSFDDQGEVGHKFELNLEPNWDVEDEDSSSLTSIFSPLMSVYCVTIESGSPRILKVESSRGEVGERLRVGDVHLLFGGVKVSWSPKGDDVAIPPNTRGDGDLLIYQKSVVWWIRVIELGNFTTLTNIYHNYLRVAFATSSIRSACSKSLVSSDTNKSASSQFSVTTSVQLISMLNGG